MKKKLRVTGIVCMAVVLGACGDAGHAPEASSPVVEAGAPAKKRVGPGTVAPVSRDGVRYEALQWGKVRDLGQNGGYIVAFDEASGKELWTLKVYDVVYDGDMEDDKQDVFITSLRFDEQGRLLVEHEKGGRYAVDPGDRSVRRLP